MSYTDEIRQMPEALRSFAGYAEESAAGFSEKIKEMFRNGKPDKIIFSGMGSSLFVSGIACTYLRRKGINAFTLEANELVRFDRPVVGDETLLVAVSQSGNSMETVRLCEVYRSAPLITVTSREDGNLASYGRFQVFIKSGEEKFTSSKSYTNSVAAMVYLAMIITGESSSVPEFCAELKKCAGQMQLILDDRTLPQDADEFLLPCRRLTIVGSGASYSTVEHGALVMLETAKILSSEYTAGQFIHGPVEIIDDSFGCIIFDFDLEVRDDIDRVISLTEGYGGRTWIITDRKDLTEHERRKVTVYPCGNVFLSPLLEIVPIQLWAKFNAEKNGLAPGVLHRVHK